MPDQKLEHSIQAAFYTSALVDNMLEVTTKGIAVMASRSTRRARSIALTGVYVLVTGSSSSADGQQFFEARLGVLL